MWIFELLPQVAPRKRPVSTPWCLLDLSYIKEPENRYLMVSARELFVVDPHLSLTLLSLQ